MSPKTLAIFALTLLLRQSTAQTGEGCWMKTCPTPGQVRLNARYDPNSGVMVGGCNCGCDPSMADPASLNYCPPPQVVDFDAYTLEGNCGCGCPSTTNRNCQMPHVFDDQNCRCDCPPTTNKNCPAPSYFSDRTCGCHCDMGGVGTACIIANRLVPGSIVNPDCTCDVSLISCPGNQVIDMTTGLCGCPDYTIIDKQILYFPVCPGNQVRNGLSCECEPRQAPTMPSPTTPPPVVATVPTPFPTISTPAPVVPRVPTTPAPVLVSPPQVPLVPGLPPILLTVPGNPVIPAPAPAPVAIVNPVPTIPVQPVVPIGGPIQQPVTPTPPPLTPTMPIFNPASTVTIACPPHQDCGCPLNTRADCVLYCDAGNDACKDRVLQCNNDGFNCVINCVAGQACGGAAKIFGPARGSLTVNCGGSQACEGATEIHGENTQDMGVFCTGTQSCKGSVAMKFGQGHNTLSCTGGPDACSGMEAINIHVPQTALSFNCQGANCPNAAVGGAVSVICDMPGDCECPPGTQGDCILTCEGGNDACKDGILSCNNNGNCVVNCNEGQACAGSAQINGPAGGSLTVNCIGMQACEGGVTIDNTAGTDMSVACEGGQACKGSITLNYGSGVGSLACTGVADACSGWAAGAVKMPATAKGFSCTGAYCPADVPAAFGQAGSGPVPALPAFVF